MGSFFNNSAVNTGFDAGTANVHAGVSAASAALGQIAETHRNDMNKYAELVSRANTPGMPREYSQNLMNVANQFARNKMNIVDPEGTQAVNWNPWAQNTVDSGYATRLAQETALTRLGKTNPNHPLVKMSQETYNPLSGAVKDYETKYNNLNNIDATFAAGGYKGQEDQYRQDRATAAAEAQRSFANKVKLQGIHNARISSLFDYGGGNNKYLEDIGYTGYLSPNKQVDGLSTFPTQQQIGTYTANNSIIK